MVTLEPQIDQRGKCWNGLQTDDSSFDAASVLPLPPESGDNLPLIDQGRADPCDQPVVSLNIFVMMMIQVLSSSFGLLVEDHCG